MGTRGLFGFIGVEGKVKFFYLLLNVLYIGGQRGKQACIT